MKSILFFIESLDGGGAEGATQNIVENLDKSKFDIYVVSETDNEMRTETIRQNSHYHCFAKKNLYGSKIKELKNQLIYKFSASASPALVRKTLIGGKYDIEVACCEGYATRLIGNSTDINSKKIAWIHTDFLNNHWSKDVYPGGEDEEKKTYEKYDAIVCVSETIKTSFIQKYGMEEKIHLIHNIVDDQKIRNLGAESFNIKVKRPFFVMAGSFLKVKGYDRAVRVFARLRDLGYDFHVMIMGIGYERSDIEKIIDKTNMNKYIELSEYQKNPYKYFANADAFICSSYAEGYSTTVTEAIILGTPVITTECSGMKEIFGDKRCGIICENSEDGLFESIKDILDNPEKLVEFRNQAALRKNNFKKESLIKEIENFFETI